MTPEQFDREKTYQAALAVARAMHRQGVIDDGDLDKMERVFRRKFFPLSALFRARTLDVYVFYGKMSATERSGNTMTITKIQAPPKPPERLRVAGYSRVSDGKDAMLRSLSAQVSYYSAMIQRNPAWLYAGTYADEALTGTKDARPEFQRLLADCRAGRIDAVITKSVSRFARNTVDTLETVRELRARGVDVFFEEQGVHTLGADGEFLLTLLASYAQEESYSCSENCKWRIRKDFQEGKPTPCKVYGYTRAFEIVPEEAAVVKGIFADYLGGMGVLAIQKKLLAGGMKFSVNTLRQMLTKNSSHLRKHFEGFTHPATAPTNLQKIFTSC
jgi:DNA invertase Pin-like site-specific DNA recombinase